jgi:hypothetical protein
MLFHFHCRVREGNVVLHRAFRAAATVLAPAALLVAAAGTAAATTPLPAKLAPSACGGIIEISQLAFSPATVARGQSSTAGLVARNCTGTSQQTTETWLGSFIGSAAGIPPGCPVIDPLAQQADFPAHGQLSSSVGYTVFSSCTAIELQVTVKITSSTGTLLAQQTATLAITAPPAS